MISVASRAGGWQIGASEQGGRYVRQFGAEDYVRIHAGVAEEAGRALVPDPLATGRAYETIGPAFTAFRMEPFAAAGLAIQWPGRAIAWAIMTPACRKDRRVGVWLRAEIRNRLPALMLEHGLRRIEADVHGSGGGIAWVQSLGFEVEAHMERYGPDGADFFRFVRLG